MIKDNGKGYPHAENGHQSAGNGLKNMRRRIDSIGGQFVISNGKGLSIVMKVPLQKL